VEEPNGKKWNALKCADVAITAGTKITVKTGGGGGFGLPEKRLKKSIKEDKKQGYIN
jgi:N-methylhydantoinase B/oxoprolinase/acetone carboxylase alpha subunit